MSSEIGGSSRETLGPLTELRVEVFQGCCTCWICKGDLGWGGGANGWGGGVGIEASRLITNLILEKRCILQKPSGSLLVSLLRFPSPSPPTSPATSGVSQTSA